MSINWQHPGVKLREKGSASLTDAELLAVLISSGIKGKSAQDIGEAIITKTRSLKVGNRYG